MRRRDRVAPETTTENAVSDRGAATQQPAQRRDIGMSTGAAATDGLVESIGVVTELLVSGGMLSRYRRHQFGRGALNKKIMSLPLGPGRRWSAAGVALPHKRLDADSVLPWARELRTEEAK